MVDSYGNNLVFLLSVPRSGSSLATIMLQNHSNVFASQEMWYLMSLYDLQHAPARAYGGQGIVKQFFNGMLTSEMFEGACRAFAQHVYNGLAHSGSADIIIDKSPRYYYNLEFLDRLFPQSKRIWLIRNPLAILASYKKVNEHAGGRFNLLEDFRSPEFHIKMADITIGMFRYMSYFSQENPYAHRVYYERLVGSPKEELQKLCQFIGISYEEGMERYGSFMDTAKSDLYFSMGVGDPFVGQHEEPHQDSLHLWKQILTKEEVSLYCRAMGADLFMKLGYNDVLEEAEAWTGEQFTLEPDFELLQLRTDQLAEATGCLWEENYTMKTETARGIAPQEVPHTEEAMSVSPEVLQLQLTLRALENRLEKSHKEQRRLMAELQHMREKADRLKSIVPFGRQLSQWASTRIVSSRRNT